MPRVLELRGLERRLMFPRICMETVEVLFPQRQPLAPKNRVDGREMKEEVGQGVLEEELRCGQPDDCITRVTFQRSRLGAKEPARL